MNDSAHEELGPIASSDVEMQFIGSRSLLSGEDVGARVCYQGKAVYYDPQPRNVTPRDLSQSPRKRSITDGDESNVACDLLLVDNTGPVLVTLWGNVVNVWYSSVRNPATPFVNLVGMRVADLPARSTWHGTSLTPIRVLHSTPTIGSRPGTTLTMLPSPTSPYLMSVMYIAPMPPVCVTQFMSVRSKLKAPFRITLRGIISDLSEMLLSQQEATKRTFNVVDDAGMWIRCCALGLSARSRALANDN